MPGMDGFSLAEKLRSYTADAVIIFLTSHEDQAIHGYKAKALRYIIKLNLHRDIVEALDRAVEEVHAADDRTVLLHRYNEHRRIAHKDILYVNRVARQLKIVTATQGEITDTRGIAEFYALLQDSRFLFIDRSCFVNIDYIAQISGQELYLTNGQTLPISRRSLQAVKSAVIERWGN